MKNLFLFLFFGLLLSGQAHSQVVRDTLYLIFDKDTPKKSKDIAPYLHVNTPLIIQAGMYKFINEYGTYYFFQYPLYGGAMLDFKKVPNGLMQTIPMSQLANYPAKTIDQLDQEMQPLRDIDREQGGGLEYCLA